MKDFNFTFPEVKKTGETTTVSMTIQAKTFEEAKMIINTQILMSSPRLVFEWFKLEEDLYTGVKIYC